MKTILAILLLTQPVMAQQFKYSPFIGEPLAVQGINLNLNKNINHIPEHDFMIATVCEDESKWYEAGIKVTCTFVISRDILDQMKDNGVTVLGAMFKGEE